MPKKSFELFGNPLIHPVSLILIVNCLVYILQVFDSSHQLIYWFGLIPGFVVERGFIWQIFTYGFLHSPSGFLPFHLLFNMYAFFMLSTILIPTLGKWKFTGLYFLSQLGGGILVLVFAFLNQVLFEGEMVFLDPWGDPTIGASGAVFGLLAVFGMIFPEMEIFLLFIRVQARNAVWISLFIGYGVVLILGAQISNTGHLGGAIAGFAFYYFFLRNANLSPQIPFPIKLRKKKTQEEFIKKVDEPIEDVFAVQVQTNQRLLESLEKMGNEERIRTLIPLQVPDANICAPSAFDTKDPVCLRCEWIANCSLRKEKENS